MNSDRVESLDSIRGIAALLVAIDHTVLSVVKPPIDSLLFYCVTFMGAFAVGSFFLLSGFVVFLSLEKISPLEFLAHRVFRLYPIIIVAVVMRLLSQIYWGARDFNLETIKLFLYNISLFGNLFIPIEKNIEPIVWTLTIEVKFYILMAVIFAISKNNKERKLFPVLIIVAFLLMISSIFFPSLGNPRSIDLALAVTSLPILLIGSSVYMFYKKKISSLNFYVLISLLLFSFSCAPLVENISFNKNFSAWILSGLFFMMCIFLPNFDKLLSKKWLLNLGYISYPLYAIHSMVVEFNIHLNPHGDHSALILRSLVISIGVSYLLHKFVEYPSQMWAKIRFRVHRK